MSLADAMSPNNLLVYEMNGAALPQPHGAPVRLIAPGWYGVANVKWLNRIEVRDTRYMGRFMARDYVTIREEQHNGDTESVETSVGRNLLKSAPAKVTRKDGQYRIVGAAWGAPVARVEVQVDGGPWRPASSIKVTRPSLRGPSGRWIGRMQRRENTRLLRAPSIRRAMCNQLWTLRVSPRKKPIGKATGK